MIQHVGVSLIHLPILGLLVLISRVGAADHLFPLATNLALKPIRPEVLHCQSPIDFPTNIEIEANTIIVSTPTSGANTIRGFIWSKEIWTSSCNEGFFGIQSKHFRIKGALISEAECMEGVKRYLTGSLQSPVLPPYPCSWMSNSESSSIFILITPHDATLDHFTNSYTDPL